MKTNISILFISLLATTFFACDKTNEGDNYLKGEFVTQYVEITAAFEDDPDLDYVAAVEGEEDFLVTFQVRNAFQQEIIVSYDVSGAINLPNQTVVIPRGQLSVDVEIPLPQGTVVPPATHADALVTLKKGVLKDGTALRIGYNTDPADQVVLLRAVLE